MLSLCVFKFNVDGVLKDKLGLAEIGVRKNKGNVLFMFSKMWVFAILMKWGVNYFESFHCLLRNLHDKWSDSSNAFA